MRVLLTSTAGSGHVRPLLPFAAALTARGDEVLFIVPADAVELVGAAAFAVHEGGSHDSAEMAALWARFETAPKQEASRIVECDIFATRCTEAMLPAVRQVVNEWAPDLVLREPCEYAGGIVALDRGVPQAIVGISAAATEWSVLQMVSPILDRHGEGASDALGQAAFLTRMPETLDPSPFPNTIRVRDDVAGVAAEGAQVLGSWWPGDTRPLVYVTFGTVVGRLDRARRLYEASIDALAGLDLRVLVTTGRGFEPERLDRLSNDVRVEQWIDQELVLPHCRAVVCHGGSGTTFAALRCGVPIAFVPMFADQPANARAVVRAGAGLLIEGDSSPEGIPEIGPEHPDRIRSMVERLLAEPSFGEAARRLAAELDSQLPIGTALDRVRRPAD